MTTASPPGPFSQVKIFADGADVPAIRKAARDPLIAGFTTNPTLMRKAGVDDYERFAREALESVPDKPICFEVIADDADAMIRQGRLIASWAPNVFVKIPITFTDGQTTDRVVRTLVADGVQLNVTALLTVEQVVSAVDALAGEVAAYVSVFAGRIADTGRDPVPIMTEALALVRSRPGAQLIWASPREVLNAVQADAIGCDVITLTDDLLAKLPSLGRDLSELSLDTVRMFADDAVRAGYRL